MRARRVKGKASRIQSSRIGSALVCVRRNVQHRELKLPKSTQYALITAVMTAVPTDGPTGCLVSHSPLYSQNIQSHKKSPSSHRAWGETQTIRLALGANPGGKERIKGKANRSVCCHPVYSGRQVCPLLLLMVGGREAQI